jgi:hypothetical protein
VTAAYASHSTGKEYGLAAWKGEIRSDFLQFEVSKKRDPEW